MTKFNVTIGVFPNHFQFNDIDEDQFHWDYRSENGALTVLIGETEYTFHPASCGPIVVERALALGEEE